MKPSHRVCAQLRISLQVWTFVTGDYVTASAAFIQNSDMALTLYIGSADFYFYALDGITGTMQWYNLFICLKSPCSFSTETQLKYVCTYMYVYMFAYTICIYISIYIYQFKALHIILAGNIKMRAPSGPRRWLLPTTVCWSMALRVHRRMLLMAHLPRLT